MGRAPCCEKVGLKKGRWTEEEDELLTKYIQVNGEGSWRSLPKNAGLLRCGKSCRLRWINYLKAGLKRGNISAEEEDLIVKLHTSFGNRWSLIASHLPGRTDNEIKNYWNSHLSRKIYSFRRATNLDTTHIGSTDTPNNVPIYPKPKPGRTSRWAMKKNKTYIHNNKGNNNINNNQNNPKDEIALRQLNPREKEDDVVPTPPTPSLESEGFCNTVEDLMVLDSEPNNNNNNGVEKEEEEEEKEKEKEKAECPTTYEKENKDMLLGPSDEQVEDLTNNINNNDGGELSLDDMLDNFMLQEIVCGVHNLNEDFEINNNNNNSDYVSEESEINNKVVISEVDEYLDWESIMEFTNNNNSNNSESSEGCYLEQKENLLTWLWKDDDDDWESDYMNMDSSEKQNDDDVVAWFLS